MIIWLQGTGLGEGGRTVTVESFIPEDLVGPLPLTLVNFQPPSSPCTEHCFSNIARLRWQSSNLFFFLGYN